MRLEVIMEIMSAAMEYCRREPELVMWRCFWGLFGGTLGLQLAVALSFANR